jgi:hypothetical protein
MPNNCLSPLIPSYNCALQAFAFWAMIVQNDFVDTAASAEAFNVRCTAVLSYKAFMLYILIVKITQWHSFYISALHLPSEHAL